MCARTPKHRCIRDIGNTTEKNKKTRKEVGVETQDRGATLSRLQVSGNGCVVFGAAEVRTGFVGIALVEVISSFVGMSEVES